MIIVFLLVDYILYFVKIIAPLTEQISFLWQETKYLRLRGNLKITVRFIPISTYPVKTWSYTAISVSKCQAVR